MPPDNSKSEQLEKKVREIAPEKADKVLTRYQKVQEGLHDALFGDTEPEKYSAAEAGMKRLEEMEDEILANAKATENAGAAEKPGTHKDQREALVTNFDAELGSIADSLGIGLSIEAAVEKEALAKEALAKEALAKEALAKEALAKEAMEKDVKYYFGQIDANLHDFFNRSIASQDRFVQAYMKRGKRPRTDARTIAASFREAIPYFHQANEAECAIVKASYGDINKALMLFVNGKAAEASKILWTIKTKIDGARVIESDLVPKLRAEKEKMRDAQDKHLFACAAMRRLVEKENGGDPIRKAEAQEKMLMTYRALLGVAADFVKLREDFVVFGPNGEDFKDAREAIFVKLVDDDLRSVKSMAVKMVEVEKKVVDPIKFDALNVLPQPKEKIVKVPKLVARDKVIFIANAVELESKIGDTDLALLSVRRDLFLMTGDEKYRKDFDKGQEKINTDVKTAAIKDIDKTEDGTVDMKAEVKKEIEWMAIQFAQIQKIQGDDPLEAMQKNTFFLKGLYDLRERLGRPILGVHLKVSSLDPLAAPDITRGTSLDQFSFANLENESPALHEAFVVGIDRYINMSHQMQVADIFGKDRVFVKYIKDMVDFAKATQDFVTDFHDFMKAAQDDDGNFSEERLGGIRRKIAEFKGGTPIFENVLTAPIFERLKEYEALIVGVVPGFEKEFQQFEKQMEQMEKMRAGVCQVMTFLEQAKSQEWVLSWENVINWLSKLAAGVVVAVVLGAMFVGSGGGLLAVMVVGTYVGAGGYIGWVAQSQLIDDRPEKFTAEGLLTAAAFGAAFGIAGKFIGRPFGIAVGKFAQKTNVRLASMTAPKWTGNVGNKLVGGLRKFGERGLTRQATQLMNQFAQHSFAREIPKEFLQEIFDDILEHLGKVIAPHHPWVGFMFQVLAAGMYHAKTVKIDATFSLNEDVTVSMTDSSVSFEFSDKALALEALRKHGAPAEVIADFEANGFVNAVKDGVTIIIRPSNEPVVVRHLLANQTGQNAALLAGLRFHEAEVDPVTGLMTDGEYTFEGSPEALMARLEGEFLVETTPDGDIIATDLEGNKIKFTFANKHLGLEVAGLLNSGLELDAERQPVIARAENVVPVLRQLREMGFELEQVPNGIVAKKAGQPTVEIKVSEEVAAEVAEDGRDILSLAAALNEDNDGFAARMLAKLNGAKSKVGEALLWATVKAQVELQSLMGRIGRALEARAGRSAAADLALPGGLSLLISGCSVESATEWVGSWYWNRLTASPTSFLLTILLTKVALNGGAAFVLRSLVPGGSLGKVLGKSIKLSFTGLWHLGKFLISPDFKKKFDEHGQGAEFTPGVNPPNKNELGLDNFGDLSHSAQIEFNIAFSRLKTVFRALRFAMEMKTERRPVADKAGTVQQVDVQVPDVETGRAKGKAMFNGIMRLIYMNLRRADIQNGRTAEVAPAPQTVTTGMRQLRIALPAQPAARSIPSTAQELQNIESGLGHGIVNLLTGYFDTVQTLSIIQNLSVEATDAVMKLVDGYLNDRNIDEKQKAEIKAGVEKLFETIANNKPADLYRQLVEYEARRNAMIPVYEAAVTKTLALLSASQVTRPSNVLAASAKLEALLNRGYKKLNAKEWAEFKGSLEILTDFLSKHSSDPSVPQIIADLKRFDAIDKRYNDAKGKQNAFRRFLRRLKPRSSVAKATFSAAIFVAVMTALGLTGAAMFGRDDEEKAEKPATVKQPNQPGGPEGGATATVRTEVAVEDAAAVTKAAESASSGAEQDRHTRNRFFPKFIEAVKSNNKDEIAKSRAKLTAAGVEKEFPGLLDDIVKNNGNLTLLMLPKLQKLGVDVRQFTPEVAPEAPPPKEGNAPKLDAKVPEAATSSKDANPGLTPEQAEVRFNLLKQYVQILRKGKTENAEEIANKLQSNFSLDQQLLNGMKNQEWDTSIFDGLMALGIDYRDLLR